MAENVRETMNIGNICRGGVMERFERAWDEVHKNIDDVNREATARHLPVLGVTTFSDRAVAGRFSLEV
jgi:hypothetical protein